MVMKLKWLFNNMQVTVVTLGAAGLVAAGCSTKSKEGSYTYNAPPYSAASGGTAETSESQSGSSASGQTSSNAVIPLYKEAVTVGTRQVDDGTVRLHKVVKTETVNQPVQLRTESVVIDRLAGVSWQVAANGAHAFLDL